MSEIKKYRSGIPMSDDSLKEWEKAFKDVEESIEALTKPKNQKDAEIQRLKRLRQQSFPDFP